MLTPSAVGATSGFMGLASVQPGERIGEHYHPFSEEFVFVICGDLMVDLDGVPHDETYPRRAARFLDELEWYANALKAARQSGVPY